MDKDETFHGSENPVEDIQTQDSVSDASATVQYQSPEYTVKKPCRNAPNSDVDNGGAEPNDVRLGIFRPPRRLVRATVVYMGISQNFFYSVCNVCAVAQSSEVGNSQLCICSNIMDVKKICKSFPGMSFGSREVVLQLTGDDKFCDSVPLNCCRRGCQIRLRKTVANP